MNRIMKCLSALWIKSGMLYLCLLFVFPLFVRSQSTGMINGHEYVDLGLPSGLKWATCNVFASTTDDCGMGYAWGEKTMKYKFTKKNSKTNKKKIGDISGNSRYDVACVEWGATWRIPRESEFEELLEYGKWTWTESNASKGFLITGPNGNSIYLPATDFYATGSDEMYGCYWTATPVEGDNQKAVYLYFSRNHHNLDYFYRYQGYYIRPVSD